MARCHAYITAVSGVRRQAGREWRIDHEGMCACSPTNRSPRRTRHRPRCPAATPVRPTQPVEPSRARSCHTPGGGSYERTKERTNKWVNGPACKLCFLRVGTLGLLGSTRRRKEVTEHVLNKPPKLDRTNIGHEAASACPSQRTDPLCTVHCDIMDTPVSKLLMGAPCAFCWQPGRAYVR